MNVAHRFLCSIDTDAFSKACGVELDPWQTRLVEGEGMWIARCGRQVGKSTAAALKALRQAAFSSSALVLLVSSTERQSRELFAKVAEFVQRSGLETSEQNKGALSFSNGSRVIALPGSPATIRGFSAPKLVIIDEAAFVQMEVIAAVRPMLAVSGGDLVLISTPYVVDDHFDKEWNHGPFWKRVEVKSTECPRVPSSWLEREKASLPDWMYQREYECIPMSSANLMFAGDVLNRAFQRVEGPLEVEW